MLNPALDEAPSSQPAVVLGYEFWQARFAEDPSVIGRTIRLNRKPAVVVGVAPRTFSGLSSGTTDMWAPIVSQPFFIEGSKFLSGASEDALIMYGRLRAGATPNVVEQEIRGLAAEWRKLHPQDTWKDETLVAKPGGYVRSVHGRMSRGSGSGDGPDTQVTTVAALSGTLVFLILAVACANLGSLLLARGVAREREIAVRVSVGAGSARLVRQLFTESLVLALLGSLVGLALGSVALRVLMDVSGAPGWLDPTPDWRVVVFALVLGMTTSILFGLTPALQVARRRHRATFMRQVLIGGQVAASCVLLIVAALLVRALEKTLYTHPGFEYKQAIVIDPRLFAHGYSGESARTYLQELRARVQSVPGVSSVAFASNPPLGRKTTVLSSEHNGQSLAVHTNLIDTEFLRTMRIPIVRGRNLQARDVNSIVISESLARKFWPRENPVGQEFLMNNAKHTVVGIAGNARAMAMNNPDAVECYLLASAVDYPSMAAIVSTSVPPENVASSILQAVRNVDADVVPELELMKTSFERQTRSLRTSAAGVTLMGAVALVLACLGIIGLVAYAVSQRTKEIGIRMALGAASSHVLSVVLRQFSKPMLAGLVAGIAGAAMLSQLLRGELYGISHLDTVAYSSAVALFAVVAIAAALIPARRALKVHPMESLRHD
jgi:predicted permease